MAVIAHTLMNRNNQTLTGKQNASSRPHRSPGAARAEPARAPPPPQAAPLPVSPPPERSPEARAAARKAAGLLLPSPSSSLGSSASMAVVAGSGAPRPVPPPGRPDPRPTPPDPCPSPPDLPPRASARRGAGAAVPAWRGAVATPAAACEAAVVAPFGAGPHRGAAAAAPAAVWGRRRWRHRRPVRGGAGGTGVQCAAATPAAACVP